MLNFLIFLAILVILFGLEATRAFIFGAFGFIFWIIIILAAIGLIISAFEDKRTPEQKQKDEQAKKEKAKQEAEQAKEASEVDKKIFIFWGKVILLAILGTVALAVISSLIYQK